MSLTEYLHKEVGYTKQDISNQLPDLEVYKNQMVEYMLQNYHLDEWIDKVHQGQMYFEQKQAMQFEAVELYMHNAIE